jgi:hypothetical protein
MSFSAWASTIVTMDHSLSTLLETNTISRLSIIIRRRHTIIIYHRRAMMSLASFQEVDDRLTSLETGQQEIRSTLHQ